MLPAAAPVDTPEMRGEGKGGRPMLGVLRCIETGGAAAEEEEGPEDSEDRRSSAPSSILDPVMLISAPRGCPPGCLQTARDWAVLFL